MWAAASAMLAKIAGMQIPHMQRANTKNLLIATAGHIVPQVSEISRLPCPRTGEMTPDGYHHRPSRDGRFGNSKGAARTPEKNFLWEFQRGRKAR